MLTATQGSGEKASTSSYTYDSVGNVTSVTNGNGKVTSYSYDQLSNLVERMTSLGDKETYTYNVNNQLEKVTKSDGKTISYDYNKLDQLLKVEYSEKQDGQVLYTYDADGRRVSMSDLTGTSQYATNEEGEITGVRQGDGSLIQYEYDAYGNISKMIYPDGSTVSYTYDELDRLTSVTDVKGQKTTYSYNTAGDLTEVDRGDGTKSFLTYDKAHRLTELRHMDKQDKLISSYGYEYDDGGYIAKETIKQDGETLVHTYTYDTLGQVENMTVSDGAGKELSKLSYTYDLAGNKLTSTETVDGKESQTHFTYDDHNRLTKLESPDGTITYTYDKNGNRIASEKNSEKLDYIYDTENRLLAIKDKKGLLMAALYDGDDNRVFTASRKEGKNTYQLFQRKPKESKSGRKSPYTAPSGEENSLFWYGFSQNVLQALSTLPQTVGSIWHSIFDDVSTAYHQKVAKDRASKEGIVVNPPELGNLPGQGEVTYTSQVQDVLIPYTTREDTYNYYEERNYVNDVNREHTEVLETYDHDGKARETYSYGQGRASYLNNQTGDSYNYLTNQSGSGAIISGYDAYSSGQRGWELVGSIAKGAGTGAISGLIGGQLMGAGAGLATNVTQNIGNQAVRQVAKIGVESAVETAIDTGIDLATGNKITGQTVAMNFAFNTFTNGAGSVSPKKAPKADVVMTKPKSGDVPVTRPRKDVTPVQQLALPGPTSKPLALPAPDPAFTPSSSPVDVSLKFKAGWTTEQRAQALQKIQALTEAVIVKIQVNRKSIFAL